MKLYLIKTVPFLFLLIFISTCGDIKNEKSEVLGLNIGAKLEYEKEFMSNEKGELDKAYLICQALEEKERNFANSYVGTKFKFSSEYVASEKCKLANADASANFEMNLTYNSNRYKFDRNDLSDDNQRAHAFFSFESRSQGEHYLDKFCDAVETARKNKVKLDRVADTGAKTRSAYYVYGAEVTRVANLYEVKVAKGNETSEYRRDLFYSIKVSIPGNNSNGIIQDYAMEKYCDLNEYNYYRLKSSKTN